MEASQRYPKRGASRTQSIVSVGMPVFNGERYLDEALDSVLSQSLKDIEIIISDNASTDKTQEICEKYAALDQRVTYIRQPENRGAAWNLNYVARLASGKYFKWACYDDKLAPFFLEECVAALEQNDDAVLAFTQTQIIDATGAVTETYDDSAYILASSIPSRRYKKIHDALSRPRLCNPNHGIIRLGSLKKTAMIGAFQSSDLILLAELALHGRFIEVPKRLFFRRIHEGCSVRANPTPAQRLAWFDPSKKGNLILPRWRQLREHIRSLHRADIGIGQTALCYPVLLKWIWVHKRPLAAEAIRFMMLPVALVQGRLASSFEKAP